MKRKIITAATVAVAALSLSIAPASADHSIKVNNDGSCHETNGNPRLNNSNSNWNASAEGHDRAREANPSLLDGDDWACIDGVLTPR